ncbi:MAG: cytidylate kinase-like family protein [Deltaproteobacteria bacterium]|nr:cytidylate kinase-like family protein [Deltaproteobacteria bacterium]
MAVITISRQFGAGAWTLGERLSKRLGYRYVHSDMIKEVAAKVDVSSDQVRVLEERGPSNLLKFLDKLVAASYVERIISDKYRFVDEKTYVNVVRSIIQELYKQGNVVIIGRGSQYVLKDFADTWHLLLVGDLQYRIRSVMDKFKLNEHEAEKAIKRRDQIRARFLRFFSENESHDDPLLYDLVLNMRKISMEKAENLVIDLVSKQ